MRIGVSMMRSWENCDGPSLQMPTNTSELKVGLCLGEMQFGNVDAFLDKAQLHLWLAMLGRLRTRDRLRFIETKNSYVLRQHHEENHNHLFFCLQLDLSFFVEEDKVMVKSKQVFGYPEQSNQWIKFQEEESSSEDEKSFSKYYCLFDMERKK